jgi:hypothetical protein
VQGGECDSEGVGWKIEAHQRLGLSRHAEGVGMACGLGTRVLDMADMDEGQYCR